jgi:hypothetical protein
MGYNPANFAYQIGTGAVGARLRGSYAISF